MHNLQTVLPAYCRLLRVGNLAFIAILLWVMEKWAVMSLLTQLRFGEQLPEYVLWLLIAGTVCVAAGGYVINDVFDVKIDRINRPDSLVVTQYISKSAATRLSLILSGVGVILGLVVAWLVRSWTLCIVFVVVPGLLWFYSSSYKRLFLVGNIVIALLSGLTPMLIAFANVGYLRLTYGGILAYTTLVPDIYRWCGVFALFAFLCTLAREIVKDMQDAPGDREMECRTLPIVWGEKASKIIVTVLLLLTMALLAWVVIFHSPAFGGVLTSTAQWGSLGEGVAQCGDMVSGWKSLIANKIWCAGMAMAVLFICEIALLWAAKIPSDYGAAQRLLKLIMFLAMLCSYFLLR